MIIKNGQEMTTPPIDALPIGSVIAFSGTIAPSGYLLCNGQSVSQSLYPYLYQSIGDTYKGAKPAITGEFYLPDLRGRTIVGLDSNDSTFNSIGKNGGEKTHVLSITEIPAHSHQTSTNKLFYSDEGTVGALGETPTAVNTIAISRSSTSTGGGGAHNNLQPFQVQNWIIKADIITVKLNPDATTFTSEYLTVETPIADNSVIQSPIKYEVGNGSLAVYLMGERLIKADPDNQIDGHYIEVGETGSLSNSIQLYNIGQSVPAGIQIQFVVTGGYNP